MESNFGPRGAVFATVLVSFLFAWVPEFSLGSNAVASNIGFLWAKPISVCLLVLVASEFALYAFCWRHPPTSREVFFLHGFSGRAGRALAERFPSPEEASKLFWGSILTRGEKSVWHVEDMTRGSYARRHVREVIPNLISVGRKMRARTTQHDDIADTALLVIHGFDEGSMRGASHAELREVHESGVSIEQARVFVDHGIHGDFGPIITLSPAI